MTMGAFPLSINGSGSHGPQCMSGFVDKNYLYGVWVKLNGYPIAYRWHRPTDTMETFEISTIDSDPYDTPIYDVTDSHYATAVGVSPNVDATADEMWFAGNHHDGNDIPAVTSGHLIKCSDVENFTDPDSWSAASIAHYSGLDNTAPDNTYTYHHFARLSDGTLLHFLTQSEQGTDSRGRDLLGFKYVTGVWSPLVSNGHFATCNSVASGTEPGDEANRVYITEVYVDHNDRVHVTGIWRYADEDATSGNKPWYIYADAPFLNTWYNKAVGGDVVHAMPLTWANRAGAEITGTPLTSHRSGKSLYVDPDTGYPRVIYSDQGTGNMYAFTWTALGWTNALLPAQGGEFRDELWRGQRWRRMHTSAGRITLARAAGGLFINVGPGVKTSLSNFSANPDPVWLIEEDTYAICVAEDGDTPKIWLLPGKGPKVWA